MSFQVGDRVWIGKLKRRDDNEQYGNREGIIRNISPHTVLKNNILVELRPGRLIWFAADELEPIERSEEVA